MQQIDVAIVGMGPRGLTLLERLVEHASQLDDAVTLRVHVFDHGEFGQGAHLSHQPEHLLVNTLSSQVTLFPPNSVAGRKQGMSLVEWAHYSGYRRVGDRYRRDPSGQPISDGDYLPRSVLGEYLSWFYREIVGKLPRNIVVLEHRKRVVHVVERDAGLDVVAEDASVQSVDYAMLAMGHGKRAATEQDSMLMSFVERHRGRNPKLAYFASPYPVNKLAEIAGSATVAIQGLGLTAYDVISALSAGRGGNFVRDEQGLRYLASGREPTLRVFSRNALPFAARGVNQKGLTGKHEARFFTPEAIRSIRRSVCERHGDSQIDFERDVMPLLIKEMAFAYRSALSGTVIDVSTFQPTDEELRVLDDELWPLRQRRFESFETFRDFFYARMRSDLAEALRGNLTSPVKNATDVLRDTRDAIRVAVEFGGLTAASHRGFIENFNANANRVSFGPPRQRAEEFFALRDAGLLDLAAGPGAQVFGDEESGCFRIASSHASGVKETWADVLIIARLDAYSPLTDASALTASLLEAGTIRPYRNGDYHPGGIDVDASLHPIGADGKSRSRIWAIGFPVEGAHFFTHALPRTMILSRQTIDADVCVRGLLDQFAPRPSAAARDSPQERAVL
jgi:uncharacterized NAD(P)/FAD-binding protein YdhS